MLHPLAPDLDGALRRKQTGTHGAERPDRGTPPVNASVVVLPFETQIKKGGRPAVGPGGPNPEAASSGAMSFFARHPGVESTNRPDSAFSTTIFLEQKGGTGILLGAARCRHIAALAT